MDNQKNKTAEQFLIANGVKTENAASVLKTISEILNGTMNTCPEDEPTGITIPITLIRLRPSENECWADTFYLTLPYTQNYKVMLDGNFPNGEPLGILERKVREYLITQEGIEAIRRSCRDFNWGDLICEIGKTSQQGITWERPMKTVETPPQTLTVNQDKLLAPYDIKCRVHFYDDTGKLIHTVNNAVLNLCDGSCQYDDKDYQIVVDKGAVSAVAVIDATGAELHLAPEEAFAYIA